MDALLLDSDEGRSPIPRKSRTPRAAQGKDRPGRRSGWSPQAVWTQIGAQRMRTFDAASHSQLGSSTALGSAARDSSADSNGRLQFMGGERLRQPGCRARPLRQETHPRCGRAITPPEVRSPSASPVASRTAIGSPPCPPSSPTWRSEMTAATPFSAIAASATVSGYGVIDRARTRVPVSVACTSLRTHGLIGQRLGLWA